MQAWQATVQDEQGDIIVNPILTVYEADSVTLASIYDESGTAKANPFVGSLEGFVQFWAQSGEYEVVGASGADVTNRWHITIADPIDPLYTKRSIADLLSDTRADYSVGGVFLTRAESGSYEVVTPGDQHLTTAGGVPLYVRAKEGMLSLEHFGVTAATGDASAQLLLAIQEGILQKAKVVLPAFDLHLENEVSLSMIGDFLNGAVTIHGGGKGVSRIIVDGASAPAGGIMLDSPNSRGARFDLQGFAVLADGTVNGPGLKATMLPGGSRPSSSMALQNVDCMGLQTSLAVIGTNDLFTNGIDITGQWRAKVFNVACCGVRDTNLGDYTNTSRSWWMSEGIKVDGCYDVLIDGCRFADAVTGIYGHDVGGVSAEVFRCYRSQIDMVRVGIDHYRPGSEPQFVVSDTYINYRDTGVRAKGVRIGSISGCMIDQKDADQNSPIVPSDISLEFVKDFDVFNNHANSGSSTGDARRRQVSILDTDTAAGKVTRNIRVYNNHAYSTMAAVLFKGAETGRVDYTPGDYSQATVATPVVDNSSNKLNLLISRPYLARIRRLASQAIITAAYTPISFDTSASQDFADIWAIEAPTIINVPDGQGVSQAKLRGYAIFASNADGRRELRVSRNGSPLTVGFHAVASPVSGAPTRISVESEWIDVVASDTFTIDAYQSSGVDLGLTAYIEAEFR